MNKRRELALVKRFPELFREYGSTPQQSAMAFGCAIGDGWHDLFVMLCEDLDEVRKEDLKDLRFVQVKEKFGRLRVYLSPNNEATNELTNEYEIASGFICERCGNAGRIEIREAWLKCLCRSCRYPVWYKKLWRKLVYKIDWWRFKRRWIRIRGSLVR